MSGTLQSGASASVMGGGSASDNLQVSPRQAEGLSQIGPKDASGVEKVALRQEVARQVIAVLIVSSVLVLVVCSFVSLWTTKGRTADDVGKLLQILIAPVIGVVGTVTGFYFGAAGSGTGGPGKG